MLPIPEFFRRFAKQNRLKITRDECDDPVIAGRFGNFYVYGEGLLGVCLINKKTEHTKKKLLKLCSGSARCDLEGDTEAIFVCRTTDKAFVENAIKTLRIRRLRRMYPEQREKMIIQLKEGLARWKSSQPEITTHSRASFYRPDAR